MREEKYTSHAEELCCGGLSNCLETSKRGEAVVADGFFDSLVMHQEGWPDEPEWSKKTSETTWAGHGVLYLIWLGSIITKSGQAGMHRRMGVGTRKCAEEYGGTLLK